MTLRAGWRKTSPSALTDNSSCVEVARLPRAVGLRDSKLPEAGHLVVPVRVYADLVGRIKRGELGLELFWVVFRCGAGAGRCS